MPHADKLTVTDFTGTGLPRGFTLLWVSGLDRLEASSLAALPGSDAAAMQQPRMLWLVGGTLVTGVAARRVYAEYDPPMVNLQANADVSVEAEGAELELLSEIRPPKAMPGEFVSTYALAIALDASVVVLRVCKADKTVVRETSFGVGRNLDTAGPESSSVHVDPLGDLVEGPGVQGAAAPPTLSQWRFKEPTEILVRLQPPRYTNTARSSLSSRCTTMVAASQSKNTAVAPSRLVAQNLGA